MLTLDILELRNVLVISPAHNADFRRWQGFEVSKLSVCALIGRQHSLGALDPNEDVILHLDALATLGRVSINAIQVGPPSTGGYLMTLLPYDLDVTRAVHAGRNRMRIEIWGVKSLPADALAPAEGPGRLLFPFGTENIVGRLGLNATLTNTSERPCVGCSGGRIGCGESDAGGGRGSLRSVYAPGSLDAAADQDDQDDAVWASS